jgi:hypothetical protein
MIYEKSGGAHHPVPVAYLDTCLVIGLRKHDLGSEQEPLTELLRLRKAGQLRLMTGNETVEELGRLQPQMSPEDEVIYLLFDDVPVVDEQTLTPGVIRAGSGPKGPTVVKDSDFAALERLLPGLGDARHLFHAIRHGVAYFVTTDQKTILSRAEQIEAVYPIAIRKPSAVVAELTQRGETAMS